MKWTMIVAGGLALGLAGCQTASQQPNMIWARVDGRSVQNNPRLLQQAEIDKTICLGETQKSAVGMAPIYYRGLAGAINASIIENQRQSALLDVAKGCMAQRGYILITQEEAQARYSARSMQARRY